MLRALRTAALAALLLPTLAHSFGAAGAASAPYLKMPMGARGSGMGEAFSGIANDVNALYYNPAGLTSLEASQLSLMHLEGFGGVRYENMGLAVPAELLGIDVWGTIGISYTLVAIEDTPRTRIVPNTVNTYDQAWADRGFMFSAGASLVTVSYAWQATKLYSIGGTFKAINEKVDTISGWGLAGDIGLLSRPEVVKGLSAGLTLQNVGSSPTPSASLPITFRIGLGYDWNAPFTKEQQDDKMLLGMDIVMPVVPVDGVWHLNLGGEYQRWFDEQFAALRLGYRFNHDLGGLTMGGGLGTDLPGARLTLDYAWVPFGELGNMHRISVNAVFGAKPRSKKRSNSGYYIFPPVKVAATAGDKVARVSWEPQTGRVDGYNLYMSYNPKSGKWFHMNPKGPIVGSSQTVSGLYNGYQIYFAVSTLARKADNLYQESEKSLVVSVVPQGSSSRQPPAAQAAPAAPAARPAVNQAPAAKPAVKERPAPPALNF